MVYGMLGRIMVCQTGIWYVRLVYGMTRKNKFQNFTWSGPSMVLKLPIGIMAMDECAFEEKTNGQYLTFVNVFAKTCITHM